MECKVMEVGSFDACALIMQTMRSDLSVCRIQSLRVKFFRTLGKDFI